MSEIVTEILVGLTMLVDLAILVILVPGALNDFEKRYGKKYCGKQSEEGKARMQVGGELISAVLREPLRAGKAAHADVIDRWVLDESGSPRPIFGVPAKTVPVWDGCRLGECSLMANIDGNGIAWVPAGTYVVARSGPRSQILAIGGKCPVELPDDEDEQEEGQ